MTEEELANDVNAVRIVYDLGYHEERPTAPEEQKEEIKEEAPIVETEIITEKPKQEIKKQEPKSSDGQLGLF